VAYRETRGGRPSNRVKILQGLVLISMGDYGDLDTLLGVGTRI
jgi:hypothetical protein